MLSTDYADYTDGWGVLSTDYADYTDGWGVLSTDYADYADGWGVLFTDYADGVRNAFHRLRRLRRWCEKCFPPITLITPMARGVLSTDYADYADGWGMRSNDCVDGYYALYGTL